MLVTLNDAVKTYVTSNGAVAAFNVFGYEDAAAVIHAAEELHLPVILATNRAALDHMPVALIGGMLTKLAEQASVPVCVHLDHGKDLEAVIRAIHAGYTSVMYDGSQLPLEDNISRTRDIVRFARAGGIPVEAEIGSVGYSDPTLKVKAFMTDPEEARIFVEATEVDALAVAVGSLHRMERQNADIRFDLLQEIERQVKTPLVIHGSTGIRDDDLARLAATRVAKVNIGTALRMVFGRTLREEVEQQPDEFDRIRLFSKPMERVKEEAKQKMRLLNPSAVQKQITEGCVDNG
jgi:fructose-bisphosphate aldolase class II